jgi:DNA-binding beta-propeller fold protein YncE
MSKKHYKVKKGLTLEGQASSPSDIENGDIYYNSALGKIRQMVGGVESDIGSGGGGATAPSVVGSTTLTGGTASLAKCCFDPSTGSIWVSRFTNDSVTQINTSTMTQGLTVALGAGATPYGICFDPITESIWVVKRGTSEVVKIRASDGTILATVSTVSTTVAVCFDPVTGSIWTGGLGGSIAKIDPVSATQIASYSISPAVYGLCFDPLTNSIWTANYSANTVSKVDIIDGSFTTYSVGTGPFDLVYDPFTRSIWVTNIGAGTTSKLNPATGATIATYSTGSDGSIVFDSSTNAIWVGLYTANQLKRVNPIDGTVTDTLSVTKSNGVCFDFWTNSVWSSNDSAVVTKVTTAVRVGPLFMDESNLDKASYIDSIKARYYASSTAVTGALATISWTTKDYDTRDGMSSGTYTVPETGWYDIHCRITISGTFALNSNVDLQIQRNGTVVSEDLEDAGGAVTNLSATVSDTLLLKKGDTIRAQVSSSATGPAIVSSNTRNYFTICKRP